MSEFKNMNREIKFRAYDPSREQMYMDCLIGNKGKLVALEYEYECGDINTSYATNTNGEYPYAFKVMQFTGLKDKNGIEIYEGDILRVCNNIKSSFEVIFKNAYQGGWNLKAKKAENTISLGAREKNELEIIGNIYQNADILTN